MDVRKTTMLILLLGAMLLAQSALCATTQELRIPDYLEDQPTLPAGTTIATDYTGKAMFIYVVFNDQLPDDPGYPQTTYQDSVSVGLVNHLRNNSGGLVDLQPMRVVNPDHANGWWVSDFPLASYISEDAVDAIPGGPRYDVHRGTRIPWMAELQAEMLHKIYNAYTSHGLGNPFDGVSLVTFIYHGDVIHVPPYAYVGGYGYNSVDYTTFSFMNNLDDTFISPYSGTALPGCQQEDASYDAANQEWHLSSVWNLRWVVSHETGHFLSFAHPYVGGYDLHPGNSYFGVYSNMRQVIIDGKGPVPYHPVYLERLGWVDEVEVTETTLGLELGDIRLDREYVKVPIPNVTNQYFLLSYHGGNGMDVDLDEDGNTLYPSRGLAIWHITGSVWDLESAWGRFSDPDTLGAPVTAWQLANASTGYDNHDSFVDRADFDDQHLSEYGCYVNYHYNYGGDSHDFFGQMSGKTDFAFNSNPSTLGHNGSSYDRRAPQNVTNSMVIRVKEEYQDHVVLDIYLKARNDIMLPVADTIHFAGEPIRIRWTNDMNSYLNSTCAIQYCADPSQPLPTWETLIDRYPVASNSWYWTPDASHVSSTGKIRVKFTSTNGQVAYAEMDGTFEIRTAPNAIFADVSANTYLDYAGTPYAMSTFLFNPDEYEDLFVSQADEPSAMYVGVPPTANGAPRFFNCTSVCYPSTAVGNRGTAAADFDNDGDVDLFVTNGSTPVLMRNDNSTMVDVTAAQGLATAANQSIAAAWGDYDRDGWPDLFVVKAQCYLEPPLTACAGVQHRLFRNETHLGNGFVDVTTAAGLTGTAYSSSMSASWVDIDADGDQDLFLVNNMEIPVGPGGINNLLFINQDDGTFVEEFESRFPYEWPAMVGEKWVDMDNDADLDLVLNSYYNKPVVFYNDGNGYFNGTGSFVLVDDNDGSTSMQVFDHDLNGRMDILLLPKTSSDTPRIFANLAGASQPQYVEYTSSSGLDFTGLTLGAVARDFNDDGDMDLVLGRTLAAGDYCQITQSSAGGENLSNSYVKVRLSSPYGANPTNGLGATVTVKAGVHTQMQLVDGGSGRGGQGSPELIFGLGNYGGTVLADVQWPGGYLQSDVPLVISNSASGETLNVISDDTTPQISNVQGYYEVGPPPIGIDWTFSWETDTSCDPDYDKVTFVVPGTCWDDLTELETTTSGVEHTYAPKPGGGYVHTMIIRDRDCVPGCAFQFFVTSGTSQGVTNSASYTRKTKICVSQL